MGEEEKEDKIVKPSAALGVSGGGEGAPTEGGGNAYTLRRRAEDGTFSRSISCSPGMLTVLVDGDDGLTSDVEIRDGAHLLDPSEIISVEKTDLLGTQETAHSFLTKLDVDDAWRILVSLDIRTDVPIGHLSRGETRRLAALGGVLAKTGVVHLLDPFEGASPDVCEATAQELVRLAARSEALILVTDIEHFPSAWQMCPAVRVEAFAGERTRWGKMRAEAARLGRLIFGTPPAPPAEFRTLPQVITGVRPRVLAPEAIACESIPNPRERIAGRTHESERNSRLRRLDARLTAVGFFYGLLYRTGVLGILRKGIDRARLVRKKLKGNTSFELLPPAIKLLVLNDRFQFKRMLLLILLFVASVLAAFATL